jgi:hypothetical protein
MIMQEIPDGESFTLCQGGAIAGREVFTTATVMSGGETVGRGPCALIVPDPAAEMLPFLPSPVSLVLNDESGDGLLQPGETAQAVFEVLNLGTAELLNPVAVLSSAPDATNPLPISVLQDTSVYPNFPALETPADCQTTPQFEPRKNTTSFTLSVPAEQEPDVGRLFNLSFTGDAGGGVVSVEMPIVIGIGRTCEPATDLDGETYDGLEGLLNPVSVDLVPATYPVNVAPDTFNSGSNIPLKLRLKCGSQVLQPENLDLTPQIVGIVHETLGDLPLDAINADNNANPSDPFFSCGTNRCEFGLRTSGLPVGTVVIKIRMPDSRVFHAALTTIL